MFPHDARPIPEGSVNNLINELLTKLSETHRNRHGMAEHETNIDIIFFVFSNSCTSSTIHILLILAVVYIQWIGLVAFTLTSFIV